MICSIIVEIQFEEERLASIIFNSLNPDNVKIPSDLSFSMKIEKEKLIIELSSENFKRIQSTLEEILRLINSAQKTIKM